MEIERKWLVKREKIPFALCSLDKVHIEQSYVSFSPTIRIREIDYGRKHILTVKTLAAGIDHNLARNEYETDITGEEYRELKAVSRGHTLCKTRYNYRSDDGLIFEIDIFEEEFSGLIYLEIEFPDAESATAYSDPEWVECDVTYRSEFKNSALAEYGMPPIP